MTLDTRCSTNKKTAGKDRSISKNNNDAISRIFLSFHRSAHWPISFHACSPFPFVKNSHANKGKNNRHKANFRLHSLRASDTPYTDPKRISGGLPDDVAYTAPMLNMPSSIKELAPWRYQSGAHIRDFFVRTINGIGCVLGGRVWPSMVSNIEEFKQGFDTLSDPFRPAYRLC